MKRAINFVMAFLVGFAVMSTQGCKKGCTDPTANNYNPEAKKDDGTCDFGLGYTVPSTYTFTDANGNSTVSFDGQKQRLDMLSEMVAYLKRANTPGTQIYADTLKMMFANDSTFTWNDVNGLGMTGSTKQLKNKCAGGDELVTAIFEEYMDSIAHISDLNQTGSAGVSGVYENDGTKGPYLMNGDGLEYTQAIEKGLMGAVFYYQITAHYLSNEEMDVSNVAPVDFDNGKYYTEMEHHWDEAFGYFTSSVDYPADGTDRFFGEYAAARQELLESQTKLMLAFRTGRAAISQSDMETRDAQRVIIKDELEKVIVGSAIHYLNEAINNISKNTTRNHVLSEATAFISSLQYGANCIDGKTISTSEIDAILSTIGTDFNNVTASDLQSAKSQLSSIYGMGDIKDQL